MKQNTDYIYNSEFCVENRSTMRPQNVVILIINISVSKGFLPQKEAISSFHPIHSEHGFNNILCIEIHFYHILATFAISILFY